MNPLTYLKTLVTLCSKPPAFPALLQKNLWFVVRFFLISLFFISLIDSAVLLNRTFPLWIEKLKLQSQESLEYYPQDLIINWDLHQLVFQPDDQRELSYPEQLVSQNQELPPLFGLVLPKIETLTETEAQNLHHPRALFYLTQKHLYINASSSFGPSWSEESLSELPGFEQPFEIHKDNVGLIAQTGIEYLETTVSQGWPWIVLIMFLFVVLTKAWSVIWYAFVGWLFYRLNVEKMNTVKIFKLTLYITVIAQILSSLAHALYPETNTSYIFSLSYIVVFMVFFLQLGKRKV